MALASPWETAPANTLPVPGFALPIRRRGAAIPTYPAGRHRGGRRSAWASFWLMLKPGLEPAGRHRVGYVARYRGRHSA